MSRTLDAYRLSTIAATVPLGVMAGFFFAFAIDVAPAMTHLDGPSYAVAQQWINRSVRNLPFAAAYFGSAFLAFVPAVLAVLARRQRLALAWGAVAVLYFAAVFWVTRSINVPINEAVALWQPDALPPDWASLRDRWNEANGWRALASFVCFTSAVILTTLSRPGRSA